MAISVKELQALSLGDIIYEKVLKRIAGTNKHKVHVKRWKVTSVKLWKHKKNAGRVRVGVKHGLYNYGDVTEDSKLDDCFLTDPDEM